MSVLTHALQCLGYFPKEMPSTFMLTVNLWNIIWIKQLLKDIKEEIADPVVIYCDNTSAINISKNPIMYTKTKHISIKYHYLRELVQDKEVKLEYVEHKRENT